MKENLGVAVVGAGKWGQNLVKTFSQLNVLAAITEADIARGQHLASQYHVKFIPSYEELLNSSISAIAIATPVFTHFQLAKAALNAGKDVFVEKPMTTHVEEAAELIALAEKNKCILMVGHLLLYQPAIQFIKSFLSENKLGKVYSLNQFRKSLGTIRKEENVLYSFGVHDLAVLNYLVNEPVQSVSATSQSVISKDIADDMTVHLYYSSGIQAHLHLNWLWPVKDRHLMILGEKGALCFNELQQNVTFYRHYGNKDATVTQEGQEIIFSDTSPPLTLELQHFLECINTRSVPRSCGMQGKEVVGLMANIMKSMRKENEERIFCS